MELPGYGEVPISISSSPSSKGHIELCIRKGTLCPAAELHDRVMRLSDRAKPHPPEKPMSIRPVLETRRAQPFMEGAGVHLHRAFGFQDPSEADPFLLFDDFRNDRPEDYLAGFPWHPHRGIETITYVTKGDVEHGDSLGNSGVISSGDVQWMTAGSGIIHQEMPKGDENGAMHGFQLWGNLPSSQKMTAPRYQDIEGKDIPVVTDDDGTRARIVCGTFWGATGPVDEIAIDPAYLDIEVPPGRKKTLPVETTRHAFAYVFSGSGRFCNASDPLAVPTEPAGWSDTTPHAEAENRSLVLFDRGDEVTVEAGEEGLRFLLISGKPLGEPVAWYGPIVMNTRAELKQAFEELEAGTFLVAGPLTGGDVTVTGVEPRRLRSVLEKMREIEVPIKVIPAPPAPGAS